MDKNAMLAMILVMCIAACMMIGVISVIIILARHSKASRNMHLCEFAKVNGGSYTSLLPIEGNVIIPTDAQFKSHPEHCKAYVTDKMHSFIAQWPEGWPTFLQTKINKSYYEEGQPNPLLPAMRDAKGNILGVIPTLTDDLLFNLKKSKVGSELRGYGDREKEISQAMKNYLKPIWFFLVSGVLALLLLGSIYLQWDGNKKASHFYSQYTISEPQGK
jgi:hypothetical protein